MSHVWISLHLTGCVFNAQVSTLLPFLCAFPLQQILSSRCNVNKEAPLNSPHPSLKKILFVGKSTITFLQHGFGMSRHRERDREREKVGGGREGGSVDM